MSQQLYNIEKNIFKSRIEKKNLRLIKKFIILFLQDI